MKKTIILGLAAGVLAGQAFAGYQLTMKSVSTGEGKGRNAQAQGGNNTMVMATDANKARVEFTEGHGPVPGAGGYLITKDAGKTLFDRSTPRYAVANPRVGGSWGVHGASKMTTVRRPGCNGYVQSAALFW